MLIAMVRLHVNEQHLAASHGGIVDTLDHFEVPFFGYFANRFVDDE